MGYILKNAMVYTGGSFSRLDILIENGIISTLRKTIPVNPNIQIYDLSNMYILPGFADVHVHLREPGFSYKETIESGTLAAASAGYTAVCSMPNLDPVPDSISNLEVQIKKIRSDAVIPVYPYGSITVDQKGEQLADMEGMADRVIAFSDDGKGVQNQEIMMAAMEKAKTLGKIIAAHCEDETLVNDGYIHDGEYARANSHIGIPPDSEWRQVERDIELVKKIGCDYHVCHVSTKESVELIRQAKADGLNISCETAPHYILLHDKLLFDEGRFKMNPPIRSYEDKTALVEGLKDGTIDMVATDHAPHSPKEKNAGLRGSLFGISGLECAFPVLYTYLVKGGVLSLETLIERMCLAPKKRFGLPGSKGICQGERADITVMDLNSKYKINSSKFLSKGKSTPFDGYEVNGKCVLTMVEGRIVWQNTEE